jgi:hypothetical protein
VDHPQSSVPELDPDDLNSVAVDVTADEQHSVIRPKRWFRQPDEHKPRVRHDETDAIAGDSVSRAPAVHVSPA